MQNHESIIVGCRKNDRKSQQALFELFASKMYGHCLRYSKNTEDAQDILQEGFIKVFEKINSLKDFQQLEGWMSRVFINLALSYWRKNHSGPTFVDINETDAEDEVLGEESNLQKHKPEEVLVWINELPDNQRMVLNMYAIDGLSHQEIASVLNTTVSNTKSILSRARKALRERINSKNETK